MESLSYSVLLIPILVGFVTSVEIVDIVRHSENECYGTNVGFGFSGTPEFHYDSLRRRYRGCTYVQGNLEITNLDSANISYDLSFLSSIKIVTGYVLLGLLEEVETIPLLDLRLIRADNTYNIKRNEYGLVVALTAEPDGNPKVGLRELQLPSLREISRGKVLFSQNPLLCHMDSVAWESIVPGKEDPVTFEHTGYQQNCSCDPSCEVEGVGRCWGKGQSMCQKVKSPHCHTRCPGRCYENGIMGCCHPECAVGCWGPHDHDCEMCKYFRYGNRCVSTCPPETYPLGQECIKY